VIDSGGARLGATLVALFVVALLLYFFGSVAEILILVFMAALLAAYLSAFTDFIARLLRLPRWLSLLAACALTLMGIVAIGAVVVPPVILQAQDLMEALPGLGERVDAFTRSLADRYPVLAGAALDAQSASFYQRIGNEINAFVRGSLVPYITAGGTLAVELFSVLAMALYFTRDPASYREGFIALVPPKVRHIARTTVVDLSNTLKAWVAGQLLAMSFLAVLTALGLWLLRVPYALAFGAFTGAVAVIPFFGTIVSTLLPAMFVLTSGNVGQSVAVVLLGVLVHLVEANIVAPLIFEERIKLPPVLTILSVLVAAKVLGVLGLIVSVPLLASAIVIVRHVLISQIYGDLPAGAAKPAVLVPTQEHRFLTIP
jgi:predicted PurR-regulated permease PerM